MSSTRSSPPDRIVIRYTLLCPLDHGFEAWFRNSDAFERQSRDGQVVCPSCGAAEVRKAVMAPNVRRSAERREAPPVGDGTAPQALPVAAPASAVESPIADAQFTRMRAALRELHAKLKRDAVDVGPAFPDEARRIHEGDATPRAIYGTATDEEVRALVDDGVGIMPIPALPDERN